MFCEPLLCRLPGQVAAEVLLCVAGLRGFAGGNAARVAQLAAGAAISWVTYEEVKLRLAGV